MDKRPIEDIFDECYEKLLSGMPIEEILSLYPRHASELRELLSVAKSMHRSSPVEASDKAMVSCLIKVGEAIQQQKERSFGARLQKLFFFPSVSWARGVALTLVIFFVVWGTANVSASSVPGDPLYLVKLITEKVKYFLAINPEGQVELKIVFSETRSKELVSKFNKDGQIDVETMKAMLKEAEASINLVANLPTKQQEIYLAKLQYLNAYQKDILNNIREKSPEDQKSAVDEAICQCDQHSQMLQKVQSNGMCGSCKEKHKTCSCKK